MSDPRISGEEMYALFALGTLCGIFVLSLVLAACMRFWLAAEASLVFAVVVVADAGHVGHVILERGRIQPLVKRTKAKAGEGMHP